MTTPHSHRGFSTLVRALLSVASFIPPKTQSEVSHPCHPQFTDGETEVQAGCLHLAKVIEQ